MIRFVDGPAEGKHLLLKRAPLFLRVVYDPQLRKWDGLDQFRDAPRQHEEIHVYRRLGNASAMMLDYTEGGRRRGGKFAAARYAIVPNPPDDATARDTEAWRAWCWAQVRGEAAAATPEESR